MTLPKGYLRKWYNRKFKELRMQFGGKCFFCDSITNLEFAHIKPTGLKGMGRGRQQRYYDIKNNPLSYLLTCKKHNDLAETYFNLPDGIIQEVIKVIDNYMINHNLKPSLLNGLKQELIEKINSFNSSHPLKGYVNEI